jgi:hypothetical protein
MKLDYISILAGGNCLCNCDFCIGKNNRKNEKPHFADYEIIRKFIRKHSDKTNEISISGSSSDPLFAILSRLIICGIIGEFPRLKTSLHTHVFNDLTYELYWIVDELCVSINNKQDMEDFLALELPIKKIRVSTVVTSKSLEWLNTGEIFKISANRYTFRKNVYEPTISFPKVEGKVIGKLFGNDLMKYNNSTVAFWNYKNTNKEVKAKYLWNDGVIRNQDYWDDFKKESE